MSLLPEENKIYFCEDGGHCFICVGKDKCTNYRYGNLRDKIKLEEILIRKDYKNNDLIELKEKIDNILDKD